LRSDDTASAMPFIGETGRPSELCRYLLAPLRDGTASEADIDELRRHTDACLLCRLEYNRYYQPSKPPEST
jgi:hypothetical protein